MENYKSDLNGAVWDNTWLQPGAQAWYPDEQVVRFLARHYVQQQSIGNFELKFANDQSELKGLDLGCGKGRHVVLLAKHRIEAHGIDISQVGIDSAENWLNHEQLPGTVSVGSIANIKYPNDHFDLVICHGVLDHVLENDRSVAIQEIHRVLKPGGRLFISLISQSDSAFGQGKLIGLDTWLIKEGYEKNIPQAFFTVERIQTELSGLDITSIVQVSNETIIGRSLIGTDKQYVCDSRYYVTAFKPYHPLLLHLNKQNLQIDLGKQGSFLRVSQPQDVTQEYVNGMNDPEVTRWLVAVSKTSQSKESIGTYITHNLEDPNSLLFGFFLDKKLRGTLRLHEINISNQSAIVGLALFDKSIWRKGWGTYLLNSLREFSQEKLGLNSLTAGINKQNVGAIASFEKAGFLHAPENDRAYEFGTAQFYIWKQTDN